AGPDLSIGEVNDVGATVQEFASQDATIVVGTSIDMDMTDELRVTVVAAGLDAERQPASAQRDSARRADAARGDYRQRQAGTGRSGQSAGVTRGQAGIAAGRAASAERESEQQRAEPRKGGSQDLDDYLDI